MMWLGGVLAVFIIGLTVIVAMGWEQRAVPSPPLWTIPDISGTYTSIVGTLAGFSVASAIFIAGLDFTRASPLFPTVIGMLLAAFLILVFAALAYASIPTVAANDDAGIESLSLILANMCGCLGLSISWLALVPLLDMLELPALADIFAWVLLIVAVAASGWTALFAYRLSTASARACLAIPIVGFVLAALYRLVAARLWPALWPASEAALHFVFVALAVAGLIFSLHVSLLAVHGDTGSATRLRRGGRRLALACSAAYTVAMALTWLAVADP